MMRETAKKLRKKQDRKARNRDGNTVIDDVAGMMADSPDRRPRSMKEADEDDRDLRDQARETELNMREIQRQ